MSKIPTCVAIILYRDETRNRIAGCTISSFISLSILEGEERVAFALKLNSRTGEILSNNKTFNVIILNSSQSDLAKACGGQTVNYDLTEYLEQENLLNGHSKLQFVGENINFHLFVETVIKVETSNIFICKVVDFETKNLNEFTPLIYQNRTFGSFIAFSVK